MKENARGGFGSKIGIVLATAGSAIGLGNVWRFPYMTGENGGAIFILIYIGCVLLLGLPCMISELIIGRRAQTNTARAYGRMGGKSWALVGCLGVLTGFLIMGYYVVVSGWCLQYIIASMTNSLKGDPQYIKQYFETFSQNPIKPLFWTAIILLLSFFIIIRGVKHGIEKTSKLLMPTLLVLLIVIAFASCLLPNASEGLTFLFKPSIDKVNSGVFLGALGQSFYSLSIAMGCLCTYGSYYNKTTNIPKATIQIGIIDTLVAILAGLMIFPAAFSVGISPDSGPSLIFITIPNVFQKAFISIPIIGYVISLLFYALLSLAALTSLISLHEVCTAFLFEECKISRFKAAVIVTVFCFIVGALCSLSLGGYDGLKICGISLFDLFDFITGELFLPIGGFLTCLLIGWRMRYSDVRDEFTCGGLFRGSLFGAYYFLVRFVCPIGIFLIFLHQFGII